MKGYKYRFWHSKISLVMYGIIVTLLMISIFPISFLVLLLPTTDSDTQQIVVFIIIMVAQIICWVLHYFEGKKHVTRVYLFDDKIVEKYLWMIKKTINLNNEIEVGIGTIRAKERYIYIIDGEFLNKEYDKHGFLFLCGRSVVNRVKHTGNLIIFELTKESLAAFQDIYDGEIVYYQKYLKLQIRGE